MSKVCQLTGARPMSGHKVSHSNRKSNRRFIPNLVKKTFLDEKSGQKIKLLVTARVLRTLAINPKKFNKQITALVKKDLKKKLK